MWNCILLWKILVPSHLSTSSLCLIKSKFSPQYCTYHITALWGKRHINTIREQGLLHYEDIMILRENSVDWIDTFVLDSPLMVERIPQCPRYHPHALLCLSWVCKLNSQDEFHSLGKLSGLWRHTFRMKKQTDTILHFLSRHQFILKASDYPVSI